MRKPLDERYLSRYRLNCHQGCLAVSREAEITPLTPEPGNAGGGSVRREPQTSVHPGGGKAVDMRFFISLISLFFATFATANTVTVLTHGSFDLSLDVVEQFTAETGIEIVFLPAGDAGEALNRAILTKGRPLGDVLFGVDNAMLVRARAEGIFEPYASPELARVHSDFLVDDHIVTPATVGFVNPNIDVAELAERAIDTPTDLAQFTQSEFSNLVTVQDPASSSTGFAFLLATISRFGDPLAGIEPAVSHPGDPASWIAYWAQLRDNGVEVTDGWTDGYYTLFSYHGGTYPVIASYASSPAFEVMYGPDEPFTPPINMVGTGTAYRQIEYAGVLAGAKNVAGAHAFLDFLLSRAVQEDIPLRMSVYPVVTDAAIPAEFTEYGTVPTRAVLPAVPGDVVLAHQDRWLQVWTDVVMYGADIPVQ